MIITPFNISLYAFMITNKWSNNTYGLFEFKKKHDIYNRYNIDADYHNISHIGIDENYIYYHFSKYKMSNICIEKNIPTKQGIYNTDSYREEYNNVWKFLKESRPVWMSEQTLSDMVMAGFKE